MLRLHHNPKGAAEYFISPKRNCQPKDSFLLVFLHQIQFGENDIARNGTHQGNAFWGITHFSHVQYFNVGLHNVKDSCQMNLR